MDDLVEQSVSESASSRTEHALVLAFVTVRMVCMAQGLLCSTAGRRAYRRPRLALATFAGSLAETLWMSRRAMKRGSLDEPVPILIDVGCGLGALLSLSSAMTTEQRTTWLNWAEPATFGIAGGAALVLGNTGGSIVTAVLGSTHAATLRQPDESTLGSLIGAAGNMNNYAVCYVAIRTLVARLRRSAAETDEARRDAVERGERLAAERERGRQERLIHDSALQTLEAIAADFAGDAESVRARARAEALRLRAALRRTGNEDVPSLADALHALAIDFATEQLRVELLTGELRGELDPAATVVLRDATNEALRNVVKHAGVSRVVVRAAPARGGVEITIRDHGSGFDTTVSHDGLGIARSIVERLRDNGGVAEIWSRPGDGTRVTLWAPS